MVSTTWSGEDDDDALFGLGTPSSSDTDSLLGPDSAPRGTTPKVHTSSSFFLKIADKDDNGVGGWGSVGMLLLLLCVFTLNQGHRQVTMPTTVHHRPTD